MYIKMLVYKSELLYNISKEREGVNDMAQISLRVDDELKRGAEKL